MGSSSSHRVNGNQWKDFRGSVRTKIPGESLQEEEDKYQSKPRKASLRTVNKFDDNKVYKFEDYVFPMRERNDGSFKMPKHSTPGIKRPEQRLNLRPLAAEVVDSDSEGGSDDEPQSSELGNYTSEQSNKETPASKYDYSTKPRKKPSRRLSEEVSDSVGSFMDFQNRKKPPKTKVSDQGLTTYASLSNKNTNELNEVLSALMNCKDDDATKVIAVLKTNMHALKTALLQPNKEYVVKNPKYKADLASYAKYSPTEELYGLYCVVKSKNMEVFEFLWEKCGMLWNEHHVIPLLNEMIRAGWCKGIKKMFSLPRTHEIFEALGTHQKRNFYQCVDDICAALEDKNDTRSEIITSALLKSISKKPYATMTFMLLFKYVHCNNIKIRTKEITLDGCEKDFYCIVQDIDALFDLALEFDEVCTNQDMVEKSDPLYVLRMNGTNPNKARYYKILHKLVQLSYMCWIEPIPINDIWNSIRVGDESEFRLCCEESSRNWSIVLTLQDRYGDTHFSEVYRNEDIKNLKPKKWKPMHFMVYYNRSGMLTDMINFASRSVKRAITVDNTKKQTSDDTVILRLAVRVKSSDCFHVLWRLAYQWSLKHLYVVLKELDSKERYCELIYKILLKSHTTRDIVNFSSLEVKKDILKRMVRITENYGQDDKKLTKLISKIKKSRD